MRKKKKNTQIVMTKKQTTFFSSWLFLSLSSFFPSLVRTSAKVQVLFDSSRSPSQDMTHTHYQTQTTHTIVSLLVGWDGGNFFKGLKRNEKENEKISSFHWYPPTSSPAGLDNAKMFWKKIIICIIRCSDSPPPLVFSFFFFLTNDLSLNAVFFF